MLTLIDSSVLIASSNPREARHGVAVAALEQAAAGALAVPAAILAETMAFVMARYGVFHQRVLWDAIAASGIEVLAADEELIECAREVDRRYEDAGFGFTDCVLLASCERVRSARVLSFDRRLAAYKPSFAGSLELLP